MYIYIHIYIYIYIYTYEKTPNQRPAVRISDHESATKFRESATNFRESATNFCESATARESATTILRISDHHPPNQRPHVGISDRESATAC